MKSEKFAKHEIKQLKMIKKVDPQQKYLASFETSCASSSRKFNTNIIMENFGRAILQQGKPDFPSQSVDHAKNVYLKQMLKAIILLHKAGIYHKDMAARNMVYSKEENRYRLIDFGLSQHKKEIEEAFKPVNIKKTDEDMEDHFGEIFERGDQGTETFDYDGKYGFEKMYEAIEEDDKEAILKMNLKKIEKRLHKEHKMADIKVIIYTAMTLPERKEWDRMDYLEKYVDEESDAQKIYNEIFKKGGGKKKKIRKHKGINQKTGRLNKGYKYSDKKLKSGLKKIIKKNKK
jgi:tRNA A-37 threonylcarbamoyl transferase component Bud32